MYHPMQEPTMSAKPQAEPSDGVVELAPGDVQELLDKEARRLLGMPGAEFRRRWETGEFEGCEEREDIWEVAFLLGGLSPRR
jgi:hypothetical protein